MKNLLLTIGLVLALCGLSYGAFYVLSREPAEVREAMSEGDAMLWLRAEFQLTDEQYAAIQRLHDDYFVECSVHCAMIVEAREQGDSAEEVARLEAICERSIEAHCRKVAAQMSAKEGERYLSIVLPKIANYDHHVAPSLHLNH